MLLEQGPTPLYYQLEQILKERIQRREFAPGELLPTEEALCEAYGVSRATVRRAFDSLIAQRIISRRRGVGTFLADASNTTRSMRTLGVARRSADLPRPPFLSGARQDRG